MNARRTAIWVAAAALAATAAGCQELSKITMRSPDQICRPGQTIVVNAEIDRSGWSKWFPPVDPPPVRFYEGNRLIDEIQPLGTNHVSAEITLDEVGEHPIDAIYQPRPNDTPLQAICYAYCWDDSKVAIAVDFDRTVNRVGQFDALTAEAPLGEVQGEAAEVLNALAPYFRIVYLTEMDDEAKEAIRTWLRGNKLPSGPIFQWRHGRRYNPLSNGNQKVVLERLREQLPTLLVGIAGGAEEMQAMRANGMLALTIDEKGGLSSAPDAPVFNEWRGVWQFITYETNYPILTNPRTMLDLHDKGAEYLKWEPTGFGVGGSSDRPEPYIWQPDEPSSVPPPPVD